jgi:hypothetical protein
MTSSTTFHLDGAIADGLHRMQVRRHGLCGVKSQEIEGVLGRRLRERFDLVLSTSSGAIVAARISVAQYWRPLGLNRRCGDLVQDFGQSVYGPIHL